MSDRESWGDLLEDQTAYVRSSSSLSDSRLKTRTSDLERCDYPRRACHHQARDNPDRPTGSAGRAVVRTCREPKV